MANDILMIALDLDNNDVYFGKNGQWFDGSGNADEANHITERRIITFVMHLMKKIYFSWGDNGGNATYYKFNFGNAPYVYHL